MSNTGSGYLVTLSLKLASELLLSSPLMMRGGASRVAVLLPQTVRYAHLHGP
jgi:hypothetical protein